MRNFEPPDKDRPQRIAAKCRELADFFDTRPVYKAEDFAQLLILERDFLDACIDLALANARRYMEALQMDAYSDEMRWAAKLKRWVEGVESEIDNQASAQPDSTAS